MCSEYQNPNVSTGSTATDFTGPKWLHSTYEVSSDKPKYETLVDEEDRLNCSRTEN